MVEVGELAPDFELVSDTGETVQLSDFRGQKVVLYFYPKAGTSGCTKQACALRDIYPQIEARDAVVIGVSPDPQRALQKFREEHSLPFVLLSDPDHTVAEAYGVWGEKKRNGQRYEGIIRSHFIIDEKGHIAEKETNVKPISTADVAVKMVDV